ncbi:MAG: hypothetical protein ACFCD0_11315 [Gemmataceae bacterium]
MKPSANVPQDGHWFVLPNLKALYDSQLASQFLIDVGAQMPTQDAVKFGPVLLSR